MGIENTTKLFVASLRELLKKGNDQGLTVGNLISILEICSFELKMNLLVSDQPELAKLFKYYDDKDRDILLGG